MIPLQEGNNTTFTFSADLSVSVTTSALEWTYFFYRFS